MKALEHPLLAYGFRPFFLLTGLCALLLVLGWIGFLFGGWPLPLGWSPLKWHSHEMLYGLVPAAIAGFLLTAITNWTGAAPLNRGWLLGLVLLWLAGRLAMLLAGWLPPLLVSLIDLAFLPLLGIYLARVLWRYHNRRNLVMVVILALLTLGNGLMHWGFISGTDLGLRQGQQLGFYLITLLMMVIGGRIIPAFSANWLRQQGGNPEVVRRFGGLDSLALASLALLALMDLLGAPGALVGVCAWVAALANGLRLLLWAGWLTAREPLLWILHLGYAWIVIALALRGWAALAPEFSPSLWQHALGIGAIGTLLLGVMTRVAMGHTGRPMQLVRGGLWIYLAILLAAPLRLAAAAGLLDYRLGVTLAALAWILAFGLFVVLYWPILSRPRADGRPG